MCVYYRMCVLSGVGVGCQVSAHYHRLPVCVIGSFRSAQIGH